MPEDNRVTFKKYKESKPELRSLYPATLIFKCNGHNCLCPRKNPEYSSYESFLGNLPENKLKTTKMMEETSTVVVVVSTKYSVFVCISWSPCRF